jgi:hypothetical protein
MGAAVFCASLACASATAGVATPVLAAAAALLWAGAVASGAIFGFLVMDFAFGGNVGKDLPLNLTWLCAGAITTGAANIDCRRPILRPTEFAIAAAKAPIP